MDKETRNDIREATEAARKLLTEDFAEQLLADFNVHSDGRIDAKPRSPELTGQHAKIIAAIQHKRAAGFSAADAVADYLRDAAFTTLNRFVALKMLEARELVQQCVTKGEESSGYGEFCGLMPGLRLLPNRAGYRLYIESLFDELSTEVKVLFDRRDPAAVLWPRRPAFDQLLILLNDIKLASVWGEDETIGWVYQYFNSKDERAEMRDFKKSGSQAPRDSRELAVRNQFFTPRYVVQFLTDNTLGRIWYEMRNKQTRLADQCAYLVRRPGEVSSPRAKKDPRDIRLLDPASGSGHFLLYAFDLFLVIYEEAYGDANSPPSESTGYSLAQDYPTLDDLRRSIPALILENNLHGVDIDARCAQIAQLALWMRAQKAFRDFGLGRTNRTNIRRSNIAIAEPLVADAHITQVFSTKLGNDALSGLFNSLIDLLKLAGDLGLLIRLEKFVRSPRAQQDLFAPPADRIRAALDQFSRETENVTNTQRRIFVDDAVQGMALLELAEKRFDVVLMNPPFGLCTLRAKSVLQSSYPDDWTDLYAAFIVRGLELCAPGGRLGAITSNLWLSIKRQETLRDRVTSRSTLELVVDLGGGVLDGATVDTSLAVVSALPAGKEHIVGYCRPAAEISDRERFCHWQFVDVSSFSSIPSKPFCFDLGSERLDLWSAQTERFDPHVALTFKGNATFDNFRFLRCWWEVNSSEIGTSWIRYDKGGDYQPFFNPTVLVWRFKDVATENRAFQHLHYSTDAQVMQSSKHWLKPGLCYSRACMAFSPRILAEGHVVNDMSIAILPVRPETTIQVLGLLVSSHVEDLLSAFGDYRKIEKGAVANLPLAQSMLVETLGEHALNGVEAVWELESTRETSPIYFRPALSGERSSAVARAGESIDSIDCTVSHLLFGRDTPARNRKSDITRRVLGGRFSDDSKDLSCAVVSYCVGLSFGRWSRDSLQGQRPRITALPFSLPTAPPGATIGCGGIIDIRPLDEGHPEDFAAAVLVEHERNFGAADKDEVRLWLRRDFFRHHLEEYSQSGRVAPIYWQLATPSASYSIWLYIHAFSRDTFFRAQEDYAATKLRHEDRKLQSLRQEHGPDAGPMERRAIADQEAFVDELRGFLEEIRRVTPLWNPNLDDGVLLNFAPLWRLVPQNRAWQKELKAAWDGLCNAEYDWAHLAMHLWPERVVPKCATDRSLAIAHGLEAAFWVQGADGKWTARATPTRPIAELVQERSSPAVKAALTSLLEAPVATGATRKPRKGKANA